MNLTTVADSLGISLAEARLHRAGALLSFMEELGDMISDYERRYEKAMREDWPHLELALLAAGWDETAQAYQKALVEVKWLLKKRTPRMLAREQLEEWMINSARAYPMSELIDLKRNKAICPFHAERTPSFSVYKNKYHCFGCGAKGDPIQFVMETRGLSFKDAVRALA